MSKPAATIWSAPLAALLILLAAAGASFAARAPLPVVAVITTGGTIAEKTDPKSGKLVPALSGPDLLQAVPGLDKLAKIRVSQFCNLDSSHMTPEIWAELSRAVDAALAKPEVVGAVVTHGTDTMAEGAFFLDLTLKSSKPVAFVGSMRSSSDLSPDGPANLYNAVAQVISPQARKWGVTVTLNQYINSARWVTKTQTSNVQTFNSGEKGYLGYILGGRVIPFNQRLPRIRLPLPDKLAPVTLLTTYAGDDGRFIRNETNRGVWGIVLEALGAGNVNPQVFQAVQYAIAKGVTVVITTRVSHGPVFPAYGDVGGGAQLKAAGAIMGGDLPGPKARLVLMLALPRIQKPSELKKLFQ